MRRNSSKPVTWDTAISPRVLLETEEPSLDQSPSNHGQTMEGRGSDLRILLHQCLSHSVWRWPQYHQLTTHTQHEAGRRNNGTSKPVGMSWNGWNRWNGRSLWEWRVTSVFEQSPQFHLCFFEMFVIVSDSNFHPQLWAYQVLCYR